MTAAQRKQGMEEWKAAHPAQPPAAPGEAESFTLPQGYDDTADHIANFFSAVVTREHVVEDEVFGNNAAIGCHLANHSYFHRSVATWDAADEEDQGLSSEDPQGVSENEHYFAQNFLEGYGRSGCGGHCGGGRLWAKAAQPAHRAATLQRARAAAQGL